MNKQLLFSIFLLVFNNFIFASDEIDTANPWSFIFTEKPDSLQPYGYEGVCEKIQSPVCNVKYDAYVGKKGIVLNNGEPSYNRGLYTYWAVRLENGENLYLKDYKPKTDNVLQEFDGIGSLKTYEMLSSLVGKSVIEGSELVINGFKMSSNINSVVLEGFKEPFRMDQFEFLKLVLTFQEGRSDDKIIATSINNTLITKDMFENTYEVKTAPYIFRELNFLPFISVRLIVSDDLSFRTLLKIQYSSSSWLFAEKYIIKAGDFLHKSENLDFKRDNSAKKIWEWIEFEAEPSDFELIRKIIEEKDSAIRFFGKDYKDDHIFTNSEKISLDKQIKLTNYLMNQ